MKQTSRHDAEDESSRLAALLPGVGWTRVLLAVAAAQIANVVVPVVLIVVYSLLATGPQGAPAEGSVSEFAGRVSTCSLPILTLAAATWAGRGARSMSTSLEGLLVGLLVAGTFGLLFFWPDDSRSLTPFTLTIVAGLVGGLISSRKTGAGG